jgi:hypothetical protein
MVDMTMRMRAPGYPRVSFNSGINSKFMPQILARRVGGIRPTDTTAKILIILF